jgi:ATP-dependent helicase Lhr and Lhr-like helicase
VGLLREIRRNASEGELMAVSGADPLNLVGLVTPGARLPALTANRVLYRDGIPIARLVAGEVEFMESVAGEAKWTARNTLLRRQAPRVLAFLD